MSTIHPVSRRHQRGPALPLLLWTMSTVAPLPAQVVYNWNGGAGDWRVAANWTPGSIPSSANASVFIDSGLAANSEVTLTGASGMAGSLTIDSGDTFRFTGSTVAGYEFVLAKGAFPGSGTIVNNGRMVISAGTGTAMLRMGNSSLAQSYLLSGTGTIEMSGSGARITGSQLDTLTNESRISGEGSIQSISLVNSGTIVASTAGKSLLLNPPFVFTNTGRLRAETGATLIIDPPQPVMNNHNGVIEADGVNAVVELRSNSLSGGTLETRNGGVILLNDSALFLDGSVDPVTISGGSTVRIPNGMGPDGKGTYIVNGTLLLDSTGSGSLFQVFDQQGSGTASLILSGTGSVVMSGQTGNIFNGASGSTLTFNIPVTGGGNIGGNALNITNNATATASGAAALTLDPATTFTNNAVGRALQGSTLRLSTGVFMNAQGLFLAEGPGAIVDVFAGEVRGGLLEGRNGGEVRFTTNVAAVNGNASPATILGQARVTSASNPMFSGTVKVEGDVRVDATGPTTTSITVPPSGALALTGHGSVTLANHANSQIGGSNASLTNHTFIRGAGKLGANGLNITNGGEVNADQSLGLTIDPRTTFENTVTGIVRSSGTGGLLLNTGAYTNLGLFEAAGGSITSAAFGVTFTNYNATTDTLTGGRYRVAGPHSMVLGNVGPVVINAADVELSGIGSVFVPINSLAENRGIFTLRDNRNFSPPLGLLNSGTIRVDGTAVLSVNGSLTESGDTAELAFELPVLAPGASYDAIDVNGQTALDGKLTLTLSPELAATLTRGEVITLLTSGSPITGDFDNAQRGKRIAETNGFGTFRVHYGPSSQYGANKIVITSFERSPVVVNFELNPGTGIHDGEIQIDVVVRGTPGVTYDLEVSRDMSAWTVVQTVVTSESTGLATFQWFEAPSTSSFFLRATLRE